ncbi:PqqD family peptide modification chaperone [Kitasatospora sp. NPDC006786]|uniref:PqqD family peptide modification chaperone n=1 Tax=unclassified Kitasatospora TaxID=2633591 RepID=UPI0033DA90B5
MRDAGLTLIESVLRRHYALDDDDIVYVGGSVADGIATPWSDVDVFLIRDEVGPAADGMRLVPMPHDDIPMDLEVWSRGEVDGLLGKLRGLRSESRRDHRAFMRLSDDDRDFLHSLAIAIPVHNEGKLLELKAELDRDLLAQLSLARALVGITNSQTDLLGWLESGDWQSVGVACQRLLEFAASALLAAIGCTHPGGKWLTSLLRDQFKDREVPPRLLADAESLSDRFYALQTRPGCAEAVNGYARACVGFANVAVMYAQTFGVKDLDHAVRTVLWSPDPPSPPSDGRSNPTLSCRAQLRYDSGCWYLLHVGREMYRINATAAAMVLLLDGRSTEEEVVNAFQDVSSADRDQLAKSLNDLLMFLENADLLAHRGAS